MSESAEVSIRRVEEQLEGAERTLSSLRQLDRVEAQRLGERMDRLASQLLAVTEPRTMADIHDDLGTEPLRGHAPAELTDEMGPPDGEG
jgi:hypothetical protein